tara:strand:- start:192 stop:734 length:543 start_codon:yes stop_codon:yes gene_type:complete
VEQEFKTILEAIGEDTSREGLKDTPARAAKSFAFLTNGYQQSIEDIVNNAIFEADSDQMVIVKNIELYSLCEHHLLPFIGKCHVAYLPNAKVIGLSKIGRIVNVFSRRLQIQERLTHEIASCIQNITNAHGVAVIVECQHLCMMMRGVEKQSSSMTTSTMLGEFRNNPSSRAEFLSLINS